MVEPKRTIQASTDTFTMTHAVRGIDDYGYAKRGAIIRVSREMLEDAVDIHGVLEQQFDRMLRPWNYPDHLVFPTIDLFPRWNRLVTTYREWRDERRSSDEDYQ